MNKKNKFLGFFYSRKEFSGCCIYKKPKEFGESSSSEDSDDECDLCKGHVDKKKKMRGGGKVVENGGSTVEVIEESTLNVPDEDNPKQIVPNPDE